MRITVNGKPQSVEESLNIEGLTRQLALNVRQLAIERNRQIVPKSRYDEVILCEGDEIEIVHFIGGG